jgi:DNA-binding HxlR family transcriptional regulator
MSQAFAAPLPHTPGHTFPAVSGAEPKLEDFDRLMGQPVRMGILRALSAHDVLSFSDIKRMMKITDGNLSMHARKLEDALLISCTKGFRGRFPRTEYRLTDDGRQIFAAFLALRHREQS